MSENETSTVAKKSSLPLNEIIQGDCIQILRTLPNKSADLIFADPPYNLQLRNELIRPNQTLVDAVNDNWDRFSDFQEYDRFTRAWLEACHRVLKDDGTIWVIGTYHNIFRVGSIMQDLGFWILNNVIWHKTNPMPNFRGTRFTNATETLIWAKKTERQKRYTFNYHAMKNMNEEKQMPNVWHIPLCTGSERIKVNGEKAHSTQKPESLLYRVILASSNSGDTVLDPFFGSGTTGAVAKKLNRNFVGIEQELDYVGIARQRIESIRNIPLDDNVLVTNSRRNQPRVRFSALVEAGHLSVGQILYGKKRECQAIIHADGTLLSGEARGSIHKVAASLLGQTAFNGWDFWYFENANGERISIDQLREKYRKEHSLKG
jgi:site-specific DNA-methyltransferase (adenine-specific)/modification methylase